MILNSRDDYTACIAEVKEKLEGSSNYDKARFTCLSNYKEDLKKHIP